MPLIVPAHAARRQSRPHAGRPFGVVRVGGVAVLHVRTQWDLRRRVPQVAGLACRPAPYDITPDGDVIVNFGAADARG